MADQRVDLNRATAEELGQLPGVGPVLAERIVARRESVGPYQRTSDVTAVRGIGETSYRALAGRLTVDSASGNSSGNGEEPRLTEHGASGEEESASIDERDSAETEAVDSREGAIEVVPPGESLSEEAMPSEGGATEPDEGRAASAAESGDREAQPPEELEAAVGLSDEPPTEGAGPDEETRAEARADQELPGVEPEPSTDAEDVRVEEASQVAEESDEGPTADERLSKARLGSPVETTEAASWWRRLSWLWTAVLGGLLGMVFALVAFAGINGSLDVGHSRAVLEIESTIRSLNAEVVTLKTDVDSLRRRLEALEGLTARMDQVESDISDLSAQTEDLAEQTGALEQSVDGLSMEVETVREDVTQLQDRAEQAQSFFSGLQMLLTDVFGEVEDASMSAPTPNPEGK